eukprot:3796838-Alexandrium_andersonii.AAC.1
MSPQDAACAGAAVGAVVGACASWRARAPHCQPPAPPRLPRPAQASKGWPPRAGATGARVAGGRWRGP